MKKNGFSLIEVALAVLLVSIGLTTIFALFPLGLQESDSAIQDTQEAMFVDYVFNTIEGNCLSITNWSDWNPADFHAFVTKAIYGIDAKLIPGSGNTWAIDPSGTGLMVECLTLQKAIEFPDPGAEGFARYLRYRLIIRNEDTSGALKDVQLEVKSGKYGGFTYPQSYSTRVVFMGM